MEFVLYSRTKRQKFHHFSEVLLYPHILENAHDRKENHDRESLKKRLVWKLIKSGYFRFSYLKYLTNGRYLKVTEYTTCVHSNVAAARAYLKSTVNPANENLMRTYHPALSHISIVYAVMEGSQNCIWIVSTPTAHYYIESTHTGNRKTQIVPRIKRPNPLV